MRDMLSVRETKLRAATEGIPVSEYAIRQWIRIGAIPARKAGRTILVYYPNFRAYVTCADGVGDAAAQLP